MSDDIKNLPPEERIKRLKKLEEERKKEIEEAQREIRKSEEELTERRKWIEKVPIPEFAQEELAGLSEEGKEILKTQKGIKKRKEEGTGDKGLEEEVAPARKGNKEISLEEEVAREKPVIPPEILHSEYALSLSRRPVKEIQKDVADIHQAVEEQGYMTREQERRIQYDISALEQKRQSGYSFSEEAARAASVTRQAGASLLYKSLKESYQA